ncbi:PAAR domain-containing protein [Burkholderia ubonensis]|uniref:PAAR domain-containing protein n=1 Tax=Burkholderia ubonensis TaxID=101571 RepID=UPI0009B35C33|nr:PAAR domain-containing protein [Burkholderia ubonensis]
MFDAIRLGDATDHGGRVVSASSNMRIDGRCVARKGDKVTCPKHPDVSPNLIIDGFEQGTNNGVPVARHGYRATCGCRLISSLR